MPVLINRKLQEPDPNNLQDIEEKGQDSTVYLSQLNKTNQSNQDVDMQKLSETLMMNNPDLNESQVLAQLQHLQQQSRIHPNGKDASANVTMSGPTMDLIAISNESSKLVQNTDE